MESPQFQKIGRYILVADVEEECLVMLPPDTRYSALSYVWDANFKEVVINSMHRLCENAHLRLFVTTGTDSNSGLDMVKLNAL